MEEELKPCECESTEEVIETPEVVEEVTPEVTE